MKRPSLFQWTCLVMAVPRGFLHMIVPKLSCRWLIRQLSHQNSAGLEYIFPLRAKRGGVLRRSGHTEAAIDLSRLAGFEAAGVLVEIMNEDGSMARLPQLQEMAKTLDMKIISIKDLIEYRLQTDSLIEEVLKVDMPTKYGHFILHIFRERNSPESGEHFALVKGNWGKRMSP